jgi:rod shape-determining protein MreD
MNRPHYILLPANPLFVLMTILSAFLINILPWGQWYGVPDMVALVLVFWSIHQPRMVGIGLAFFMGLMMDVHDATLLGQHALAYTLLSYFAIMIHRRVLWFPMATQALHILPLLVMAQAVQLVVRMFVSGKFPGWLYFLESLTATAVWPLVSWLLLAPQRRAIDRDDTRPI